MRQFIIRASLMLVGAAFVAGISAGVTGCERETVYEGRGRDVHYDDRDRGWDRDHDRGYEERQEHEERR